MPITSFTCQHRTEFRTNTSNFFFADSYVFSKQSPLFLPSSFNQVSYPFSYFTTLVGRYFSFSLITPLGNYPFYLIFILGPFLSMFNTNRTLYLIIYYFSSVFFFSSYSYHHSIYSFLIFRICPYIISSIFLSI